ncbi:sigma-70 family RNA polymerase sigma factor [Rugamonas sp.]|uniref:RNA polymerase sigma factor n=1 Tax=Rugamonas sp. TaxID=1926287 RepID=UPI0025ED177E|nr:sigma-70 family RNA polymerase sigma factor [Rugamonas sp.]
MTALQPRSGAASDAPADPDQRYRHAITLYGADLARFAMGYERETARRQELLQDIHVALWQSFAGFQDQCSLRSWVYRIAHNVSVSHIQRSMKTVARIDLDDGAADAVIDVHAAIDLTERRLDLQRLLALIHRLAPLDRQVMLLYLEDLDAATIGDISGISARNVATKVHRIKALLAKQLGSTPS